MCVHVYMCVCVCAHIHGTQHYMETLYIMLFSHKQTKKKSKIAITKQTRNRYTAWQNFHHI